MEDSTEISTSVFFGLQGIPNPLEDPQNPKVRYQLRKIKYTSYISKLEWHYQLIIKQNKSFRNLNMEVKAKVGEKSPIGG